MEVGAEKGTGHGQGPSRRAASATGFALTASGGGKGLREGLFACQNKMGTAS